MNRMRYIIEFDYLESLINSIQDLLRMSDMDDEDIYEYIEELENKSRSLSIKYFNDLRKKLRDEQ